MLMGSVPARAPCRISGRLYPFLNSADRTHQVVTQHIMFPSPTSFRRGRFLLPLLIFLSSSLLFGVSLENVDSIIDDDDVSLEFIHKNINGEDTIYKQTIKHYYFRHEIDFLTNQALVLGDYSDVADKKSTDIDIEAEEKMHKLRFIEKSLQIELDYIRRFRDLKAMPKANDSLAAEHSDKMYSRQVSDPKNIKSTTWSGKNKIAQEQKLLGVNSPNNFYSVISNATWSTWAPLPPSADHPDTKETFEMDHQLDSDWISMYGFQNFKEKLKCDKHGLVQNKPLYTPEMWNVLWKAFQESTLFPYPIPQSDECTDRPYYTGYAPGRGRGNFASRDIPKGSLVHSGHPNTVFFLNYQSVNRFLSALPKMFACDVIEWAWTQDLTNSGNVILCLNMDPAAFFNDGAQDNSINMDLKLEASFLDYYSTEDIMKGAELMYDYDNTDLDQTEMDL